MNPTQVYPTSQTYMPARSAPVQTWPTRAYPASLRSSVLTAPLNVPKSKLSQWIAKYTPAQLASYTVNIAAGVGLAWFLLRRLMK